MKKCFTLLSFTFILFLGTLAQVKLSGKIIDKITQELLPNTTIYVDNQKTPSFTLIDGSFELLLNAGEHTITIVRKDYDQVIQKIIIEKDAVILFEMYKEGTSPKDESIYKSLFTDEVIVRAVRAKDYEPLVFDNIEKEAIAKENLGKDLPYILEKQPSVVVASDAGNGVGYTSMWIRGTDMTRINFTVNGIPYNDGESQAVFLVDMPDLASSLKNIQIQRGVGTSTNGAAAFGASVNLNTNNKNEKAYAEINNSVGSFGTIKNTLKFGTGFINKHFTFDGRASHLMSNGYIDRASTKLWSYYLSGAYYGISTIIRFNHFSGKERTYQAWNGVDSATLANNRTYNISGTDWGAKAEPYKDEVDDYKQDHYQLFISQQFKTNWTANVALFYTKGKGYFEQYKVQSNFVDYNLNNVIQGNDTISQTDLVRRRWLNNYFWGSTFSLNYNKINKIDFILGGAWNQYNGDHYGEIIWAQYASNADIYQKYYENNGLKTDFNIYAKASYYITKRILAFADLQYRNVAYNVSGIDNDQRYLYEDVDFHFFNPKFGLNYFINNRHNIYASFAMAGREPTRNDFIDNTNQPKAEKLYNLETGYKYKGKNVYFTANYYYMHYKNQLVLTGKLNDVGSAVRTNVNKSFRTGIELIGGLNILKYASIDANVTWSVNEIKEFKDENAVVHNKTKISYSPQWIGGANLEVFPLKDFTIGFYNKIVGKQFLDNTSNNRLGLNRYYHSDFGMQYTVHTKPVKDISFLFRLNNFTNRKIVSNGYVYGGTPYYFPQATINFMFGLNLRF